MKMKQYKTDRRLLWALILGLFALSWFFPALCKGSYTRIGRLMWLWQWYLEGNTSQSNLLINIGLDLGISTVFAVVTGWLIQCFAVMWRTRSRPQTEHAGGTLRR
jgi:hypothetical protein